LDVIDLKLEMFWKRLRSTTSPSVTINHLRLLLTLIIPTAQCPPETIIGTV